MVNIPVYLNGLKRINKFQLEIFDGFIAFKLWSLTFFQLDKIIVVLLNKDIFLFAFLLS